jgi:hypothetical protein
MLERFSYRGSQVEYLTMDLTPSLSFDKRIICNLLPNLREIHFKQFEFSATGSNHLSSPFQFTYPSLLKLEKLSDCAKCELARELAISNMCSNLNSLYLSSSDPLSGDILSQLKNMPVLETLTLGNFQLKLMDLEMVHCNIPSIQKLILKNIFPAPLEMMVNLEALTYLKIDNHDIIIPLNFSQLVEACPATFTDLIIEGVKLTFNESTSNISSIQYLSLTDVNFTGKATITGTNFPELSVFYLSALITRHLLMIALPDHHLKKVTIEIDCPEGEDCALSINTMNNGKAQRSLIRPGDEHDYKGQPSCGDTPTPSSTEKIIMEFTCASVKEIFNSISKIN